MAVILSIGFLMIFVGVISFVIYQSEKERKEYLKKMSVGDSVVVPVETKFVGKISEISEDFVIVTVKVPKTRVYPSKTTL